MLSTCDLPAKFTFIKIISFNREYGCPVYEFILRKSYVFLMDYTNFVIGMQSTLIKKILENMNNHAREAQRMGEAVFGVKSQTA